MNCWWCGRKPAMNAGLVEVEINDGNKVKVHKCCKPSVEKEYRSSAARIYPVKEPHQYTSINGAIVKESSD